MSTYKLANGNTLEVLQDDQPSSPREWDNLGTMVCFHRKYLLGDKHDYKSSDFAGWEDMKKKLIKKHNTAVILPLYLYDHSGITMKTTPFNDRWDSGQVGYIYVTKSSAREEYKVSRMNKKLIEKLTEILIAEVETYDQYLTGDVYYFRVLDEHGEEIDACHGFYGDNPKENGMIDHLNTTIVE